MSPARFPDDGYIAPAKIVEYLLNPDHPDGGPKAISFRRHGFGASQGDGLALAPFSHARPENFARETVSSRGDVKFVFEGTIETPFGHAVRIRSVWLIDGLGTGHLITAYPV